MVAATLIGQPVFTVGAGVAVGLAGLAYGDSRVVTAALIALATIGVDTILKLTLRRRRPLTDYVLNMRFDTFSFPSGHAAGSVAVYGMLAVFGWLIFSLPVSLLITALIAGLIAYIGLSRIYLGAHYPSDVLAGWLLGLAGLYGIIVVMGTP